MLRVIVADNFPQAEAAFRQVGTDVVIVQQQAGATPYCLIAAADEITSRTLLGRLPDLEPTTGPRPTFYMPCCADCLMDQLQQVGFLGGIQPDLSPAMAA